MLGFFPSSFFPYLAFQRRAQSPRSFRRGFRASPPSGRRPSYGIGKQDGVHFDVAPGASPPSGRGSLVVWLSPSSPRPPLLLCIASTVGSTPGSLLSAGLPRTYTSTSLSHLNHLVHPNSQRNGSPYRRVTRKTRSLPPASYEYPRLRRTFPFE